jgi:uncharacterized protein with WD repeat
VEYLADVIRVILHMKVLGHDFGHAPTSPEFRVVSGLQRSG